MNFQKKLQGKKITLIGGAGFIGHNLALKLASLGAVVSIIDGLQINSLLYLYQTNFHIINRELYIKFIDERLTLLSDNNIPLYVQDARDCVKLFRILDEIKPSIVVLLAAVSHANRSNKDPYTTFDHSLRTLENTLAWCRGKSNCLSQFVYFSSSMVYGNFTGGIVSEESICKPIGIYGALKFAGEKMVIANNQVFDIPYTIIRPTALYGERCISRRVVQIFAENAIIGKPVQVNGDGTDRLDFTYIDDLVQGVLCSLSNINATNEIFNIAYGSSRSLSELISVIKQNFPEINVEYLPKDRLKPDRGTLSVEKAKQLIGYQPQYPIELGIARYSNWYKEKYKYLTPFGAMA